MPIINKHTARAAILILEKHNIELKKLVKQ